MTGQGTMRAVLLPWSETGEAWHAAAAAWERHLAEQLGLALDDLPSSRDEALRLRYAVRLLRQVRGLLPLTEAPKRKPWAERHERCVDCSRTDREHKAGGRCVICWEEWRRRARPDRGAAGGGDVRHAGRG